MTLFLGMHEASGQSALDWVEPRLMLKYNTTFKCHHKCYHSAGTRHAHQLNYTDGLTKLTLQLSQKASQKLLQSFGYSSHLSIDSLSPSSFAIAAQVCFLKFVSRGVVLHLTNQWLLYM